MTVRGLRERPRIAVAQMLVACCMIAVGFLLGALVTGDSDAVPRAAQSRLDGAERALRQSRADARVARAEVASLTEQLARARRRVGEEERVNARLVRELRRSQQARRRLARRR